MKRKSANSLLGMGPIPAMVGLLCLASLTQLKLQAFEAKSTIDKADQVKKWYVDRPEIAKRGPIYSRDMQPLAQEVPAHYLSINYSKVPRSQGLAIALSEATGIPAHSFLDKESGSRSWMEPLTPEQKSRVQQIRKDWNADGISIEDIPHRIYPLAEFASPVVGYLRQAGKKVESAGLEKSLNDKLTGQNGLQRGLKDKNGEFLPLRSYEPEKIKQDGKVIVTTIDSQIQVSAAKAIRKAVESNKADDGVAIVIQPKTGEILAMASWPASDPNLGFGQDYDGSNPCYKMILEPGSTFKILTMVKALDEEVIQPETMINCTGTFFVNNKSSIRCDAHNGSRAHGAINTITAISKSCNVCAAQWALRIGQSKYLKYLRDLGLMEPTGLELLGERKNLIRVDKGAPKLQLATWGFGQSLNLTPLSLAGAFATIANEGRRMPLRLIKSVDGKEEPIRLPKRVLGEQACRETMAGMRAVMEMGTGRSLQIPGFDLGGKTGTAQKFGKNGPIGYVSNFVGVLPASDPQAVVLVMVNNPKGNKYYGSEVAGPVFVDVAKSVIKSLKIAAR